MRKRGMLGVIGAFLLAGSLAFGTKAYAQGVRRDSVTPKPQPNSIYSRNVESSASGEGVFLKNFVYNLPDSSVNLGGWLGLYSNKGNISYDVVSTRKGLENILSYLRRGTQTREKRASINNIRGLLQKMSETDSASLNALRMAVADGVVESGEIAGIKPNTYMIIARSPSGQGYASQSIPVLVNIAARPTPPVEATPPVTVAPPVAPPITIVPERKPGQDTLRDTTPRIREMLTPKPRKPRRHRREEYSPRLKPQAGLETQLGDNNELSIGAFGNVPLGRYLRVEAFGNYSVVRGDSYLSSADTSVTERPKENIGNNVYRLRTDEVMRSVNEVGFAEAGLGLTISPHRSGFLEIPLRIGVKRFRGTENLQERSTIRYGQDSTGNGGGDDDCDDDDHGRGHGDDDDCDDDDHDNVSMSPGDSSGNDEIITSRLKSNYFRDRLSLSAGARFKINRNMTLGLSYNRVGRRNNGRVSFRINF